LLLCAFMTCLFIRLIFIGSGLDLDFFSFWCSLSLQVLSGTYVSIFSNYCA
jgi:hypothetical protein